MSATLGREPMPPVKPYRLRRREQGRVQEFAGGAVNFTPNGGLDYHALVALPSWELQERDRTGFSLNPAAGAGAGAGHPLPRRRFDDAERSFFQRRRKCHEQEPGRKEEHQEGTDQDTEGKERSQATQEGREKVLKSRDGRDGRDGRDDVTVVTNVTA